MSKKPYTVQDAINDPKGCLFRIFKWSAIIFVTMILIGLLLPESETISYDIPQNIISKTTFSGEWAFTTDTVILHHRKINNNLDGVEVTIKDKTYALTRNIEDRAFLPNDLWLNAEMEQIDKYKVCNDVMIDVNTCKKSLSDIIRYAEKLPLE